MVAQVCIDGPEACRNWLCLPVTERQDGPRGRIGEQRGTGSSAGYTWTDRGQCRAQPVVDGRHDGHCGVDLIACARSQCASQLRVERLQPGRRVRTGDPPPGTIFPARVRGRAAWHGCHQEVSAIGAGNEITGTQQRDVGSRLRVQRGSYGIHRLEGECARAETNESARSFATDARTVCSYYADIAATRSAHYGARVGILREYHRRAAVRHHEVLAPNRGAQVAAPRVTAAHAHSQPAERSHDRQVTARGNSPQRIARVTVAAGSALAARQ